MSQGYSACTWSLGEAISGEKCQDMYAYYNFEIPSKPTMIYAWYSWKWKLVPEYNSIANHNYLSLTCLYVITTWQLGTTDRSDNKDSYVKRHYFWDAIIYHVDKASCLTAFLHKITVPISWSTQHSWWGLVLVKKHCTQWVTFSLLI